MKIKQILCCLLVLALFMPFMPMTAFAEGETSHGYLSEMTLNRTNSDSNQLSGFVTNIKVRDTQGNILFDSFEQNQTVYELELTDTFLGKFHHGEGMPSFCFTVTDKSLLRYSVSLESVDIGDNEPIIRDGMIPNNLFYNSTDEQISLLWETYSEYGFTKSRTLFDGLDMGQYLLKINVHEIDDLENGDVYTFLISFVPSLTALHTFVENTEITLNPQASNLPDLANINSEFSTRTNASTLTLQGKLQSSGTTVLLNGVDITEDFTGSGIVIDLTEYEKDVSGVYMVPFFLEYSRGTLTQRKEYTLHILATDEDNLKVTQQPLGGTYDKGTLITLSVKCNAVESDVTYQWQSSNTKSFVGEGTQDIPGANLCAFIAPTEVGGTRYYRCKLTRERTGEIIYSEVAEVTVNVGQPNAPVIVYQPGTVQILENGERPPYQTTYHQGEKILPIPFAVGTTESDLFSGDKPVYLEIAWYYNTEASIDSAVQIAVVTRPYGSIYGEPYDDVGNKLGIVANSYLITEKLAAGEHYYYFVVTAINTADESLRTSVTSDFVKITVIGRDGVEGFDGKGTEDDPCLIRSVEDLQKIDKLVLSGDFLGAVVFQFANDITLPADWEPIGENNGGNGIYLLPFSGTIDGNGKTLFYEPGARSLLEYARDAEVRNLKIFGEEINGAGLLDKVSVDYGTDGEYQELTDPDVITIENVTLLSGSKTAGSGLANGGYNSGINNIFVKNCTVEENVIVGYKKDRSAVGSFVGTLNGRIENSISYATVYGKNCVGGLAGAKGQSMGLCDIVNSAFIGTIEASGGKVGGILGSGYINETGPMTPPVTIRNCYVVADITGDTTESYEETGWDNGSGIGGILGSEIGMHIPNRQPTIRDCHFYGTITDTNPDIAARYVRAGGILGDFWTYDPDIFVYENNYYLENASYDGLGYLRHDALGVIDWSQYSDAFQAKTREEFADGTVTELLNGGVYKNWVQGTEGYPVHSEGAVPSELLINGEFKTDYLVGDELDMTGATFTVVYSDETETDISFDEISFTGFDGASHGIQTVTATYGPVSAEFVVQVLYPENGQKFRVLFSMWGDEEHDSTAEGETVHTMATRNLDLWIPPTVYEVGPNATVRELLEEVMTAYGMSWLNPDENGGNEGNYIEAVTYDDITIGEFTNGPDSGWMYFYNGIATTNGISEQFLEDGDEIVFRYTDDYTKEAGGGTIGGTDNVSFRSVAGANENSAAEITFTDDGYAVMTVTTGSTAITLTDTAEENTFIVSSTNDVPSVVLVKDAEGNYACREVTTENGEHKVVIGAGESVVVGILGDANGDGTLSTRDTTLILRTLTYNGTAANSSMSDLARLMVDTDGNGSLTVRDVTLMLRFLTYHGAQPNSSLNW